MRSAQTRSNALLPRSMGCRITPRGLAGEELVRERPAWVLLMRLRAIRMPPASRFWPSPYQYPAICFRGVAAAQSTRIVRNPATLLPIVHGQIRLVQMETVSGAKVIDDGQQK
jgi:hypothetical protein